MRRIDTAGRGSAAPDASCWTGGLRQRKKAQTRDAIVAAAVDLFERKGYEATTIDDIAAAANVSPRTFFRYFDSKLEVMRSPKQDQDDKTFAALIAARPASEPPVEAIYGVMRAGLEELIAEDDSMLRLLRVMLTTPSLRASALEHFHEHQALFVRVCASRLGVDEGALEPHVIAAAVSTTAWTVVDRWIAEGAAPDRLLAMFDEAFACLAAGLGSVAHTEERPAP
jgi:AcrR family transcriptional regulator